jgi:hypothetical protein
MGHRSKQEARSHRHRCVGCHRMYRCLVLVRETWICPYYRSYRRACWRCA